MSTIITENNKYVLLTKGATEIVLELCKWVQEEDGIKELTKEREKEELLSRNGKITRRINESFRVWILRNVSL
ncbi:MAG: hypothetical protein V8S33_02070 [Intestinibacter bartlettii]